MASRILKCKKCNLYTLEDTCTSCGEKTHEVKPPKYSPEDKYGKYRREYKKLHSQDASSD
jgi:H/ACA ribonucleoprotein complex subunit 3